jgi:hypothetical protein
MSSDSGDTMPDSGYIAGSRPERRRSGHLVGILDGSGCSGRISSRLAGILAGILDGSGQNGRTPGIWLDPAVLAGNWPGRPASGQLAGIQPFCAGSLLRSPESSENGRIPATLPEFVYAKYKKIFLYYFILIFFIL